MAFMTLKTVFFLKKKHFLTSIFAHFLSICYLILFITGHIWLIWFTEKAHVYKFGSDVIKEFVVTTGFDTGFLQNYVS